MPILDKDMTLCISLSSRPSNIGTRFHNFLYDELSLPFVYKAFTTTDLAGAMAGVRALGIRGCSVSMPFKEAVLDLVDTVEDSAQRIGSANTIVNDDGQLSASNTDLEAVKTLLDTRSIDPTSTVLLRGSGGMAKATVAAFRAANFDRLTVVARNHDAGTRLAGQFGYDWVAAVPAWHADVLVNVTPIGMRGPDAAELAFDAGHVAAASTVIDAVAFPAETPLVALATSLGRPVISGAEIIAEQAARQFARYTGVTPSADLVTRASAFSRE